VQVDFLIATSQRCTIVAEGDNCASENPLVKLTGSGDIGNCEHKVVKRFYEHDGSPLVFFNKVRFHLTFPGCKQQGHPAPHNNQSAMYEQVFKSCLSSANQSK
jgi:hypothetical protein